MTVELAKRAVACKDWRWMPGMRATHRHCSPIRVLVRDDGEDYECHIIAPGPNGNEIQCIDECGIMGSFPGADGSAYPVLPDLDDPATLGCLLALVRESWGSDVSVARSRSRRSRPFEGGPGFIAPGWVVDLADDSGAETELVRIVALAGSEAEALVAALEAAP